eukprot:TRINITY_DN241_c0_g1_i2.p1 TRINITY_DN241_c0_g1~~TRINITY_DN241_c0_g1_i2.p1  ORF type:complete len:264 (+),score=57.16 TRINITY_DN241_c0_g1_i2:147-938(+)
MEAVEEPCLQLATIEPVQEKRPRGRPKGSKTINRKVQPGQPRAKPKPVLDEGHDIFATTIQAHVLHVQKGEDVAAKILRLCQGQGPRALLVLSAHGRISSATLQQTAASSGTVTYEGGPYEISTMTGSFLPSGGTPNMRLRMGGLSIALAQEDGTIVGGLVAGLLIAAGPVHVVIGSFHYQLDQANTFPSRPAPPKKKIRTQVDLERPIETQENVPGVHAQPGGDGTLHDAYLQHMTGASGSGPSVLEPDAEQHYDHHYGPRI